MSRSAGYISSQTCPTNPEHGIAYRTDRGYYCPHAAHATPGKYTVNSWTLDEWESIKSGEPSPAKPERAANQPNRRAGKAKRSKKRTRSTP